MLPKKNIAPRDILDMIRRRVWLVVVPPVITTFAALVYSSSVPNLYQSDMLIEIVPQRVPDEFVRTTVTLRAEERLDAILAQVTSRTILEQMIRELDLYPNERRRMAMDDVVTKMRESIQAPLERPRNGPRGLESPHAFHVNFTYPDPIVGARVTQRLGSSFVEHNAQDRGALADATNQFLSAQLDEARVRLVAQEQRLEVFRREHGNELPTQAQANMQVIQSTQMQIQALVEALARDRDRKLMLERLLGEAESAPAPLPPSAAASQGPTANAADAVPTEASAKQQLELARAALARLERRLTPQHPDIVRSKRLIAELEPRAAHEDALRASGNAPVPVTSPDDVQRRERIGQMRAEIESLDRQTQFKISEESRLRELVSQYQRRIEAVPSVESEWSVLTRDYDTLQASYRNLLSKSEASKVALDLEQRQIGEIFRVLDPARVPIHPVKSQRLQNNAAGLALGLVFGVGLAALLELKDASFRSEADVLEVLSLPVLAVVPYVETALERTHRRRKLAVVSVVALATIAGGTYVTWTLKLWHSVL